MFKGIVQQGDKRGRLLGFPTANLAFRRAADSAAEGVYAGIAVTADGQLHRAAVSIGRRPSFYLEGFELVEAHLLDFDRDIYDEELEVRCHFRVRGQVRFETLGALTTQLRLDVVQARKLISADLLAA